MDLNRAINELRAERDQIVAAIAQIESLNNTDDVFKMLSRARRGRKPMSATERREVSARMKKYWAKRRKAQGAS